MDKQKKKNIKLIVLVALLGILVMMVLYGYRGYKELEGKWNPTFVNNKTKPFDTYICYHLLQELNGKRNVVSTRRPIYTNLKDSLENYFYYDNSENEYDAYESDNKDKYSDYSDYSDYEESEENKDSYLDEDTIIAPPTDPLSIYNDVNLTDTITYLFINKDFKLEPADKEYLLDFVGIGNNIFISAEDIDYELLNYLNVTNEGGAYLNDTIYNMVDNTDKRYNFRPVYTPQVLNIDSVKYPVRTLAKNREGKPVFVQIRYGKGNIFLHTVPNVFTNQNLVKSLKYDFAFRCLSYIPKTNKILWDEYQTQGPPSSLLEKLSKDTLLLLAFLIVILGFLIFVIFRAKRIQRIIPIIKPPANSSIEFLDTISNLYYKKKDYTVIIKKRHAYFLDFVRKNYYLSTENVDGEFIKNMSIKSGFGERSLNELFELYSEVSLYSSISSTTFLKYNSLLEEFYKVAKNK